MQENVGSDSGRRPRVTRCAFAALVALHGIAHLAGLSAAISAIRDDRALAYLAGLWDVSAPPALYVLAFLWALLAVAFIVVGVAIWENRESWPRLLLVVSATSAVFLLIALWSSAIGFGIDLLLIAIALKAGALTQPAAES